MQSLMEQIVSCFQVCPLCYNLDKPCILCVLDCPHRSSNYPFYRRYVGLFNQITVPVTRFLSPQNDSEVHLKVPEFAANLSILWRSSQLKRELRNEVGHFKSNFLWKLWTFTRLKFVKDIRFFDSSCFGRQNWQLRGKLRKIEMNFGSLVNCTQREIKTVKKLNLCCTVLWLFYCLCVSRASHKLLKESCQLFSVTLNFKSQQSRFTLAETWRH